MKKNWLSHAALLPSIGSQAALGGGDVPLPSDVAEKLDEYKDQKNQAYNVPPHIRPQPMTKYDAVQHERVESGDANTTKSPAERHTEILKRMPSTLTNQGEQRARQILKLMDNPRVSATIRPPLTPETVVFDLVGGARSFKTDPAALTGVIQAMLAVAPFGVKRHLSTKATKLLKSAQFNLDQATDAPRGAEADSVAGDDEDMLPTTPRTHKQARAGRSSGTATKSIVRNQWPENTSDRPIKSSKWYDYDTYSS